ncbi:hypothetical protein [Nocardia amikacinitolerans]|uniref:hypothetical protein n=1 Tax=Nocardia amikacinitolerans TaxID=756689 RepID=UPI0020A31B51|nr:hypothetical protein [Nocardia amikacinitolerans]MCP2274661.1 hypothetical protein [Nocardia amikacinitolerans]
MRRLSFKRHLTAAAAVSAVLATVFSGSAAAEPEVPMVDWGIAVQKLREAAEGNPMAEEAIDRLLAERDRFPAKSKVALPAQPFQIPAQSDIGRGQGPGVYGSGIALGVDGFRLGFFGGPGTISPNQGGAKMEALWVNLSNGRSGTEVLFEHEDVPVDTTIRSRALDLGPGMIVSAVYGTLWHRWSVPVSDANPDGYQYQRGTVSVPSMGAVYN